MYYAGKNGVIVTDKVVTLADGSRIFASNDGALATNEIVTSGKHQYYADENGKLVTNSVVKTKDKKQAEEKLIYRINIQDNAGIGQGRWRCTPSQ